MERNRETKGDLRKLKKKTTRKGQIERKIERHIKKLHREQEVYMSGDEKGLC
jgi:hypothetical protein